MQNKILYSGIILALIVVGLTTAVYATDLPSEFDSCNGGGGIIAAICNAVNLNHDKIDVNIADITAIETNIVTIQGDITDNENSITALTLVVNGNTSDIASLTTSVGANTSDIATIQGQISVLLAAGSGGTQFTVPLETEVSALGDINPQESDFVFYGDTLCEIEAIGFV